jgi:nucleoid-associated protein YgaU
VPGIYTLRVDQVAPDGTVTSRFETPFKRETLAALAAAAAPVADVVADPAPEPAATDVVVEAAPAAGTADPVADPAPEAVAAAEPVVEPAPEPVAAAEPVVEPAPEPVAAAEPEVEPAPEVIATADPAVEPAVVAPVTITVQPGFTLWGIADSMMGDGVMYVQVYEMNRDKIRDPDLIYPGQVFMVPQE